MLFWKKRTTPKNKSDRPIVTVDETGKVTRRVRFGARKTHPPKIVTSPDSTPRTR